MKSNVHIYKKLGSERYKRLYTTLNRPMSDTRRWIFADLSALPWVFGQNIHFSIYRNRRLVCRTPNFNTQTDDMTLYKAIVQAAREACPNKSPIYVLTNYFSNGEV